jgi:hypothetical protein
VYQSIHIHLSHSLWSKVINICSTICWMPIIQLFQTHIPTLFGSFIAVKLMSTIIGGLTLE